MARVNESERAAFRLENYIHVYLWGDRIPGFVKPQDLAIKFEMYRNASAIEQKQKILSAPLHAQDSGSHSVPIQEGCRLRAHGDLMPHAHSVDSFPANERAEGSHDGFYFGRFRHGLP
jgi:hypothetical protein